MTAISTIEDIHSGMAHDFEIHIKPETIDAFVSVTGDDAPVHVSESAARKMGFSGKITHGLLASALFSAPLGKVLPGPNSVIQSCSFSYVKPLLVGETAMGRITVTRVSVAARAVDLDLAIICRDSTLITGKSRCVFPMRSASVNL